MRVEAQGATRRRSVAVVGAGFSGLLTALHLLRNDPQVVVRLIERAPAFARGRAYGATHPDHLLNVRAANMSAFPDHPDHFVAWLRRHNDGADGDTFVSRARYGDYLQDLLRGQVGAPATAGRLLLEADEATSLQRAGDGWRIELALGRVLHVDACVLALGLMPPAPAPGADHLATGARGYLGDPWRADLSKAPGGDVLLIGSGLTMVDVALSLARPDRRLLAVSRHGLVPRRHAAAAAVAPPPDGFQTVLGGLRTLRAHAAAVGWREAVDSIRPQTAAIWRRWRPAERRRFLRHARAWWDVHRHRTAPSVSRRLAALVASGALTVEGGKIEHLTWDGHRFVASIRRRGQTKPRTRRFDLVVNCTGPRGDPATAANGLILDLHRQGHIRRDALGLGLELTADLQALGADGAPTPGLFVVGPLTRAMMWESVAAPDLRHQTRQVARTVLHGVSVDSVHF